MSEVAKLKDLDSYLRKTRLECCGHLSQFYINRNIRIAMGKHWEMCCNLPWNSFTTTIFDLQRRSRCPLQASSTER